MIMPLWNRHNRMLRRSAQLRSELLKAVGELDVFTAALAAEIGREPRERGDSDDPPSRSRP